MLILAIRYNTNIIYVVWLHVKENYTVHENFPHITKNIKMYKIINVMSNNLDITLCKNIYAIDLLMYANKTFFISINSTKKII